MALCQLCSGGHRSSTATSGCETLVSKFSLVLKKGVFIGDYGVGSFYFGKNINFDPPAPY